MEFISGTKLENWENNNNLVLVKARQNILDDFDTGIRA